MKQDWNRRHGFDFWYAYGTYDYHLTPMYWATDSTREAPYQLKNVASEKPDVVAELTEELDRRLRKNNDPWLQSWRKHWPTPVAERLPQGNVAPTAGPAAYALRRLWRMSQ